MPYDVPPNLADLTLPQIADALAARRLPPIDQWDPAEEVDSHMVIRADRTWLHEGRPINRPAMARAFASLLVQRDGQHFLMTPQCRQRVAVEDAAFVAVDVERKGDVLVFRLNTDELVLAGPGNPLRAEGDADCPAIYLAVRHGTQARINRSTWLQLVALADFSGPIPVVSSQGADFALVP